MKKTIAVIATRDTKQAEQDLAASFIAAKGMNALRIDISTRLGDYDRADVSSLDVLKAAGYTFADFARKKSKADAVEMMQRSLQVLLLRMYQDGAIHGVLALGGVQNAMICTSAMQLLPIGVPKMLISSVTSGYRPFAPFVGASDIVLVPSIADIVGINPLTEMMILNASMAIVGMTEHSGTPFKPNVPLVGATIMGATTDGIEQAIKQIESHGYHVVTFHSTGVGGTAMENLINDDQIVACMDLCLHEIVAQDVIGKGFSVGAENRLSAAVKKGIPLVLSPAGLDFIDLFWHEFQNKVIGDPDRRQYTFHNNDIVHVKLKPNEASKAAKLVVNRLKDYKGRGVMVIPNKGLRSETFPGEKLYAPEIDQIIFDILKNELNPNIKVVELDAHISDPVFSKTVSDEMLKLLRETI